MLSADGAGADALRSLWARVSSGAASNQAFLRLESTDVDVRESVGGSPILVKDGKRWFTDPGDNFTNGRHPRTLVGWTPGGDTLLVTVDGRQPGVSVGMTLHEATDLLIGLGATEGINLDGGGSTTFVRGGSVVNSVSDVQVRSGGKTLVRHSVQKGDTVARPRGAAGGVGPRGGAEHRRVGRRRSTRWPESPSGCGSRRWLCPAGRRPRRGSRPSAPGSGRALARPPWPPCDPASAPDGRLPALVGPRAGGRVAAHADGGGPRRARPGRRWLAPPRRPPPPAGSGSADSLSRARPSVSCGVPTLSEAESKALLARHGVPCRAKRWSRHRRRPPTPPTRSAFPSSSSCAARPSPTRPSGGW